MISLFYRRESVNEDTRHGDSVCLLCHAVPTQKYPSIGVMVCSPVAGSVVLSCLDYGITTSACILLYQVKWLQSAMNPAACPAGVFVVQVRAHHSTPLSATHCPLAPERIQCKLAVLACECCHGWLTLLAGRPQHYITPMISVDIITTCLPYTTINCKLLSFSDCRCSYLERPAVLCYICTISASFP